MTSVGEHIPSKPSSASSMTRRAKWVFGGFFVITLTMLAIEHREHLQDWVGFLPWLFLLACPLMHLFMHHGQGHGHEHSGKTTNGDEK